MSFLYVKRIILGNKIIIENYISMTLLQVLNSLFYLIIYPYIIRTLGVENYGEYVFALSIVTYFITFINFGFDIPALKEIATHQERNIEKSLVLSSIISAKLYLLMISILIYVGLLTFYSIMRNNSTLYIVMFLNVIVNILFPIWYFQGVQKMKLVTYIQFGLRVISLPFIFLYVKNTSDLINFAIITTLFNVLGAFVAVYILKVKEGLVFKLVRISDLLVWYKESSPFFWSNAGAALKQQSINVIVGNVFQMSDVALFDLAYKIYSIPMILFGSINNAIFPKIINSKEPKRLGKIFKFEFYSGIFVVVIVAVFGRFVIKLLAGVKLLDAYPIAILMSFGVLTMLLVGGYIYFVFVPNKRYDLVLKNQFMSLMLFFILVSVGLFLYNAIIVIAFSWAIAALFEIIYCRYLMRRNNLFY